MEKKKESAVELILKELSEKASTKQDVFANTKQVFAELKRQLELKASLLGGVMQKRDERVKVAYSTKSNFDCEMRLAGDRLIFHMHTNVFKIDESSPLWRSAYLRKSDLRGYCGIINVYNFLNDSFVYNRLNDSGYLIARIFVNSEGHFFVQGKRQLGFLYNDFINNIINPEQLSDIIDSTILYTLYFDLLTPPYDNVSEVRVHDFQNLTDNQSLRTGKRMGFSFNADNDEMA